MTSLSRLLATPGLDALTLVTGRGDAEVSAVAFVEHLSAERDAVPGTLLVAGESCSQAIVDDRLFDVTARELTACGVSALVLTGPSASKIRIDDAAAFLDRLGLAVLTAPQSVQLVWLLSALESAVHADAAHALMMLGALVDDVRTTTADPAEIVALAERALGVPVTFSDIPSGGAVAVSVGGVAVGSIRVASEPHGDERRRTFTDVTLTITAMAVERALHAQAHALADGAPARDVVLSELLVATDEHAARLSTHARSRGIPVDGWHRALSFQPTSPVDTWGPEMLVGLGRVAAAATGQEDRFLIARADAGFVLTETWSRDPRPAPSAVSLAQTMLDALDAHFPSVALRCGIGTPHSSVAGLRASVAEARVALGRSRGERIARYDAAGMRPIIVELANAGASRVAVAEMLQPLIDLGGERATQAILTLQTWLDEHGSLARTAERLTVHRNTVAYRVRQARELVEVDVDDPDQRLALQLACRAYLLTMGHE